MRIVYMGTPEFSVLPLQKLAQKFEVIAVYTQPDRPVGRGLEMAASAVKKAAIQLGIPVFQPERLYAPGEFEKLKDLAPDAIVVAAYGQILKTNVLELPRLGCINIHTSLLPRWRGAAPIQRAILAGDTQTGVTTLVMTQKLDAGPILLQASTPIERTDTAGTLHDRLSQMGAELILSTLQKLNMGDLTSRPQEEAEVTLAEKLDKEMQWMNIADTAEVLDRTVRALNPWPGTSLWVEGQRLKVRKAQVLRGINGIPGQIFERSGMLLLGTSKGTLELLEVQWEGKKPVESAGFLNGLNGRGVSLPLTVSKRNIL